MLSPDERSAILERQVTEQARQGWRVVSIANNQAQLVQGGRVSHVLHLLLTIITVGLWAIVWLIVWAANRERHRFIYVDERGVVTMT